MGCDLPIPVLSRICKWDKKTSHFRPYIFLWDKNIPQSRPKQDEIPQDPMPSRKIAILTTSTSTPLTFHTQISIKVGKLRTGAIKKKGDLF